MRARHLGPIGGLAVAMSLATSIGSPPPSTESGSIKLAASATAPARLAYLANSSLNGISGYVVNLGAARQPDGTPYTLEKTAGTGVVDLYAFFFSSLMGGIGNIAGQACPPSGVSDGAGGETGTISCGDSDGDGVLEVSDRAKFAIVIAWAGPDVRAGGAAASVNAGFELSWW